LITDAQIKNPEKTHVLATDSYKPCACRTEEEFRLLAHLPIESKPCDLSQFITVSQKENDDALYAAIDGENISITAIYCNANDISRVQTIVAPYHIPVKDRLAP